MITERLDELTHQVTRAFTVPITVVMQDGNKYNLNEVQRRSLAAVALMAGCAVEDAGAAMYEVMRGRPEWLREWKRAEQCTGYIENYAVVCAVKAIAERERERRQAASGETNVIRACFLKASFIREEDKLPPQALTHRELRYELRKLRNIGENELLWSKAIGNDNDPDVSETPELVRFYTRVTPAWVRRMKARRENV